MTKLQIDIWSDIACPWCYVGKRRLEAALARFAQPVEIHWRAFELDPSAPRLREGSYPDRLARKYGTSAPQAQVMIDRMTQTAAADGLEFRFDRIRPGNTFDAHRLVHLGGERGIQDAVKERLLRGYLTEGRAIGDPAELLELACEAGLDATEAKAVLDSDRYAAEVRADEAEARELGISGVPFFVIGGRLGVSGAQSAEVLLGALREAAPAPLEVFADGATCGPDGCA
jgi:predicted DsbA family dithiol-disulfide isomerase